MNRIICFFIFAILCITQSAIAHVASKAYIDLKASKDIHNETLISTHIKFAVADIGYALGLDRDANGEITLKELHQSGHIISQYLDSRIRIRDSLHQECLHSAYRFDLKSFDSQSYFLVSTDYHCKAEENYTLQYNALFDTTRNHSAITRLQWAENSQEFVITETDASKQFPLRQASQKIAFFSFLKSGIWHIFIGYDHIIFILALILPAIMIPRASGVIRDISCVITAFTLAHSITLFLVASEIIAVNEHYVEVFIAFSLAIAGVSIYLPKTYRFRWLIAFCFGLIHGFGFAGVLKVLLSTSEHLVRDVIAFNIGVEFGQLAIIALACPILWVVRRYRWYSRIALPSSAIAVTLFGIALTTLRI